MLANVSWLRKAKAFNIHDRTESHIHFYKLQGQQIILPANMKHIKDFFPPSISHKQVTEITRTISQKHRTPTMNCR